MVVLVYCVSSPLVNEIEDALGYSMETVRHAHWGAFERDLRQSVCGVAVLSKPIDELMRKFILRLLPQSGEPQTGGWPFLLIEDTLTFSELWREGNIPHGVIPRVGINAMLLDSVAQECARAALRMGTLELRRWQKHSILRRALLMALQLDGAANSVRALAVHSRVDESTLHRHWITDGMSTATGMSLKEFLDLVLLLKVRERKTPHLAWADVIAEQRCSYRHLCATSRRRVGHWLGEKDEEGWIALAVDFRRCIAAFAGDQCDQLTQK